MISMNNEEPEDPRDYAPDNADEQMSVRQLMAWAWQEIKEDF